MLKLSSDEKILNEEFRRDYIENHIRSKENIARKREASLRHDLLKDKTRKHVIHRLEKELKPRTVQTMQHRASNISIFKKVVNKKARVFTEGVSRVVSAKTENEADRKRAELETIQVQALTEAMKLDTEMKRVNKYEEASKNCLLYIAPRKNIEESGDEKELYDIAPEALFPYSYDVIPDEKNVTEARVVILSDFVDRNAEVDHTIIADRPGEALVNKQSYSDSKKEDNLVYEWWSKKYHFFTNSKGKLIGGGEGTNDIQMLPFIDYSFDKNGCFWSEGGDDLSEGSILLNVIITDLLCISNNQGWGQLIITNAKDDTLQGQDQGVHYAMLFTKNQEDDESPDAKYISANPPLGDWINIVKTYLTLMLITNELSPKGVAGDLAADNIVSGISKILDEADYIADLTDTYQCYADKERLLWRRVIAWYSYLNDRQALSQEFADVDAPESSDVILSFDQRKPIVSEKERTSIIKDRLAIGLDSMIDAVMRDDDSLTRAEAQAKLQRILKDNLEYMIEKRRIQQMGAELGNPIDHENTDNENADSVENTDDIDDNEN